ncbi:MAG: hypothetical protein EBY48_10310 [Opitutae bacterium]|nr:hypothetical protein [Opitutae bacterium]
MDANARDFGLIRNCKGFGGRIGTWAHGKHSQGVHLRLPVFREIPKDLAKACLVKGGELRKIFVRYFQRGILPDQADEGEFLGNLGILVGNRRKSIGK